MGREDAVEEDVLKTTKKTDPATRVATLQLLNFHISRKRMSVKLLQPYVTFIQPLSQVRKSLTTSAYLGKFA